MKREEYKQRLNELLFEELDYKRLPKNENHILGGN